MATVDKEVRVFAIAEWAYRQLDRVITLPAPIGHPELTDRADEENGLIGIYALEVCGDLPAFFELHATDGGIFEVTVARKA